MHNKILDQVHFFQFSFISCIFFLYFQKSLLSSHLGLISVGYRLRLKLFHFRKYFQVGINLSFTFQSPQLSPKYALFLASFGLIWENQKRGNWSVGVDLIRTNSQINIVLGVVIASDLFVHVGASKLVFPKRWNSRRL